MPDATMIRRAADGDVGAVAALLKPYSDAGVVLPRDEKDVRHYLGNFRVAVREDRVIGCIAARDFGNFLWEIRSLVVAPAVHGCGVGRMLVESVISEREKAGGAWQLFTLTTTPAFFIRLGFRPVERARFPEKIWSDCANCPKNDRCDETALLLSSQDQRDALPEGSRK